MKRMRTMRMVFLVLFSVGCLPVYAQFVQRYDVIISELMADPSPPVRLPEAEYVEVLNRSKEKIPLKGWTLSDPTGTGSILTDVVLEPGNYAILCAAAHAAALQHFGQAVVVSRFPTLDNNGDELYLRDAGGRTIHALAYDLSWYASDFKKNGGWSMEMKDTSQPCLDVRTHGNGSRNWAASVSAEGGSPGWAGGGMKKTTPIVMEALHSYMPNPYSVVLVTNMAIHAVLPGGGAELKVTPGQATIQQIETAEPWLDEITFHFNTPFDSAVVYTITLNRLKGCNETMLSRVQMLPSAIAHPALPGNVLINELLFNPVAPVEDYVEIYNKGPGAIDISSLRIGGKNSRNETTVSEKLLPRTKLLFPGEFLVVSERPELLVSQYLVKDSSRLLRLSGIPSYPDDAGTVLVLNGQGEILDELSYSEKWHHPLLGSHEGISLERVFYGHATNDRQNWHSAAKGNRTFENVTAISRERGYGSPGYANSQLAVEVAGAKVFTLPYSLFTPDYDGNRDFLVVEYRLPEPGWIAQVRVFDTMGRLVKRIAQQYPMGSSGFFRWDGTDTNGKLLGTGHYLFQVERFHINGKIHQWRKVVSLYRN